MPTRKIDYPSEEQHDVHERVETGPTRFGSDYTGLFIRGDDSFALAMEVITINRWYEKLPEEHKKDFQVRLAIRNLVGYEKLIREEVVEK